MSKRILAISILAIASFFVACSQGDETTPDMIKAQASAPKSLPIVTVDEFTAPASPVITEDQAKRYAKASAALVELGVRHNVARPVCDAPGRARLEIVLP